MNGIQVTNFHKRSTEPLNYLIYARPQSIKQHKQSFENSYIGRYIYIFLETCFFVLRHLKFNISETASKLNVNHETNN